MRISLLNLTLAFGVIVAVFGGREALACPTLAQCDTLSGGGTAPACCCLLWDRFGAPPASQNACLSANNYLTYNGAGAPPASCAEFNMDQESSVGFCPMGDTSKCSNQILGGRTCICKAGSFWDGDGCVAGAPPVPPVCSPPASGPDLDDHVCGTAGCTASEVPFPPPANGAGFAGLANPMAACCGRGWGENSGAASKFDCVEALPTPTTFKSFYLAGQTADNITTAGVKYPNQIFMLDKNGVPLSGFYTQNGVRCGYRKPSDKSVVTLTRDQQMEVFAAALNANPIAIPTPFPSSIDAEVDPLCCTLIVFALERFCPETNGPINGAGGKILAATIAGTRRCTAAKRMKLDYGVYDLCDTNLVHRNRFRPTTSYGGEDPRFATIEQTTDINIKNLMQVFYPPPAPGMAPSCPIAPMPNPPIWRENFTGGMCRIFGEAP